MLTHSLGVLVSKMRGGFNPLSSFLIFCGEGLDKEMDYDNDKARPLEFSGSRFYFDQCGVKRVWVFVRSLE